MVTNRQRSGLLWVSSVLLAMSTLAHAEAPLDWSAKVYGDGQHNAFTDLAYWGGQYYLCFRHGAGHLSMDGEIRVLRSGDLKAWEPCGVLDTLGDDRDPHFALSDKALYVFFGTWDLAHAADQGVPGRGRLRSHMSSTNDGQTWSAVKGVYDPEWWLWRVRWHEGAFYSIAYAIQWPSMPDPGEARLLRSEDGLAWETVSAVTRERIPDEADMRFLPDGSMEVVMRSGDKQGNAMYLRSDSARSSWERKDLDAVVHCPVLLPWKDRCFVGGRGKSDSVKSVARLWELAEGQVRELITLPSGGDTAYPGLIPLPGTETGEKPILLVSWYSQHERSPERPDEANIYIGQVTVAP
jgi:hypothetical protein